MQQKPLLHLVGILFPHINDDAGQNHIKFIIISLDSNSQTKHPDGECAQNAEF